MKTPTKKRRLKPSRDLQRAVDLYGGINGAAKAWGIEYGSLQRFLAGKGGITSGTMLGICEGSGLTMADAFEEAV